MRIPPAHPHTSLSARGCLAIGSHHLCNYCLSPRLPTYCLGVSQPHLAQREPLFFPLSSAEPPHPHPILPLWFGVLSVFSLSACPLGAPTAAQRLQISVPASLGRELKAQISISREEASSSAPPSHCVRPGVGVWREVGKGIFQICRVTCCSLFCIPSFSAESLGSFPVPLGGSCTDWPRSQRLGRRRDGGGLPPTAHL